MIAVLLGTHPQPFTRAIAIARELAGERPLVVQHGHTPPPRARATSERFVEMLPFEELRELVQHSDLVCCHGGVGSIALALDAGRHPIVIPRLRRHREHVDDHQLEIAQRLERDGLVVQWRPGSDLRALRAAAGRGPRRSAPEPLREAVWAAAPLLVT